MSDRLEIELVLNVPRFSILRAEKLPARRQIIEERAHLDLRPRRFSTIAHRLDSPARDDHLRPRDGLLFPGRQAKTRDARDAGQRFSAKT